MSVTLPVPTLTDIDVLRDLEAGRSLPLRPADRLLSLRPQPHPAIGGRTFLATWTGTRLLAALRPRLARRLLARLWFTPWIHPSGGREVIDLPDDVQPWSLALRDGGVLHGYVGGEGPTVVLVHGWAGRGADWRHLAHELIAAGHRVVVPDLPAHGMTAGTRTDLFELGAAAAAVLHHERPATVVAHSLGFPMVVLAIEHGAPQPATIVALAPGRRAAHALDGFAARLRLRPGLVAELRRAIEARFGPDVWATLDVDRVVPDLRARGIVVHDEHDDEVALSDAQAITSAWPGATLTVTHGLGHRRILRDPGVMASIVAALA